MNHDDPPQHAATPKNTPGDPPVPGGAAQAVTTAKQARRVSKSKLSQRDQIMVWVRAGGVCVLCHDYLLEGPLTGLGVSLGELAHIVGQQHTAGSPRGLHELAVERRDDADNVLLACASCHNEIDKQLVAGILDVDRLRALKAAHEKHIRRLVTLPHEAGTLVLRVAGKLRGDAFDVSRATATRTVTADGRFPSFDLDRHNEGIEIDLQGLPGEDDPREAYYVTARQVIDEVLQHKLHPAVASGEVGHVSVFPLARVPLLVHLGGRLNDNFAVDVYQRHRATQNWQWDADAQPHHFTAKLPELDAAEEAVLILNVSGTVNLEQVPAGLHALPRVMVEPDALPSPDIVRSRASLDAFCKAIREVNATLDAHKDTLRRLHVFGALPPAAAVELGRLHDSHVHPALVLHSLDNGTYRFALEISPPPPPPLPPPPPPPPSPPHERSCLTPPKGSCRSCSAAPSRSSTSAPRTLLRRSCRYTNVGEHLKDEGAHIYVQGSVPLGTVVAPYGRHGEYDLDLVCQWDVAHTSITQQALKDRVGDLLTEYIDDGRCVDDDVPKLGEGRRSWKLGYTRFHMDVLPAVPDVDSKTSTGIRLTDKQLREWRKSTRSPTRHGSVRSARRSSRWSAGRSQGLRDPRARPGLAGAHTPAPGGADPQAAPRHLLRRRPRRPSPVQPHHDPGRVRLQRRVEHPESRRCRSCSACRSSSRTATGSRGSPTRCVRRTSLTSGPTTRCDG